MKKDSRNEMEVVCQQPLIYLVCSIQKGISKKNERKNANANQKRIVR